MNLQEKIRNLPSKPGIYQYFNADGTLIYVGKAKNLKKRVSSYFLKTAQHSRKTLNMVSQIAEMEFTVVNSEWEAFLLENNFIKSFQPKYNILLRDDKTYPYICVTNEPFPRVYSTRRVNKSDGKYFGPFSNVKVMYNMLELCIKLYHIRTCDLNLSPRSIQNEKFKVCMEYHLGNCKGPCANHQSQEDYLAHIREAENVLKGNVQAAKKFLQESMAQHAANLEFEQAEVYRKKLELIVQYQSKSVVSNANSTANFHVLTVIGSEENVDMNYLKVVGGNIRYSDNYRIKRVLDELDEEIFFYKLFDFFSKERLDGKIEVLTNIETSFSIDDKITVTLPKAGFKKQLVDMSLKNLDAHIRHREMNKLDKEEEKLRVVKLLQKELHLPDLPLHIECFDNSNLQGTNAVSAVVCFKNGKPSKKDYRHYNVRTVEGPNDFDTMKEVVFRRYRRLLDEQKSLPNLIVIDGGKGQLGVAVEVLKELGIYGKVSIVSIAKRLEEIYFPGDELPLHLSKKSPAMLLLQHLRNEAHRFGITFHRKKRSRAALK
jgi:excinuclease ABC subunit C